MSATTDRHTRLLRAAETRASRLEGKLGRILEPILEQAGREAARRFRSAATDHLTASAATAALRRADTIALARARVEPGEVRQWLSQLALTAAVDVQSTSAMICLKPRPDEAAVLADPDGNPAETLHVTLCYLGEVEGDLGPVLDALRAVAASHAPLAGIVGGYGQFGLPDGSRVGILLPDVPGLVELRVAVTEALAQAGVAYSRDHGFEAHLSVDGDPEPGELEQMIGLSGQPLHFDELLVVRGDTEVLPLPLTGRPPVTAAGEPPPWTSPAGDELIDVAALVRLIRAKTDPVRRAFIQATMTPALEAAGLSWDVTNPLVGKVLSQSASQVTGIADTTRLNVMRIVRESYEQGLSIPHAAQAIREGMAAAAPVRARMIARTEIAAAANGGSLASAQLVASATGAAMFKQWLTAEGARYPRHETYDGLDGQTVALDDYFDVGGAQMQHPADPDGPPEEVIQCRCVLVYVDSLDG